MPVAGVPAEITCAVEQLSLLGAGTQLPTAVQVTTQTWTARATGRSATVDVVELFRVADGRIVEIRVFQQDTHALLATLEGQA